MTQAAAYHRMSIGAGTVLDASDAEDAVAAGAAASICSGDVREIVEAAEEFQRAVGHAPRAAGDTAGVDANAPSSGIGVAP